MPQAALLVDVVKRSLRERRLTYARVAKALNTREGMTMVMAIRPWELALFAALRRAPARPNQAG